LETFEFRGAPIARELLAAVDVLRVMNRTNVRKVPADAPVGFLRRRWKRYVFADGDVDRRYYEFAVMSELKNALRGSDVWVPGSRQFKDFDEYLLPRDDRQIQGQLGLPVPTSAQAYLDERLALLRHELDVTNKLATAGELPDVEITERGLKISPIEDDTPDGAEALRYRAYRMRDRRSEPAPADRRCPHRVRRPARLESHQPHGRLSLAERQTGRERPIPIAAPPAATARRAWRTKIPVF
jgi:hypothetical protein